MTDEIETRRACPGCGANIALLKTKSGKYSPANITPSDARFRDVLPEVDDFAQGWHESHFQTCSNNGPLRDLIRGLNAEI